MTALAQIQLRDARDRLIDLLGLGHTYPQRGSLPAQEIQQKVVHNTPARISIENSQKGVIYQLYDTDKDQPVLHEGIEFKAEGNGGTIYLDTPPITADITYRIRAAKSVSEKWAYLYQQAVVKAGIDKTLAAWIHSAPHLDPTTGEPTDALPRICDYGASVEVEVAQSQEGVGYQLVYQQARENGQDPEEEVISREDVPGNLHNIVLTTKPVEEDIEIRVRATRNFDTHTNGEGAIVDPASDGFLRTDLLDIVLPLKVRANPELDLSVEPSSIIAFAAAPTLVISNSQSSVRYRPYIRTIPDREIIHGSAPGRNLPRVPVEDEPDVQILAPAREELWREPEDYTALEDQQGSGEEIRFTLPPLTEESVVIVKAAKAHRISQDPAVNTTVESAIQLAQAVAILVQPDPEPPDLQLRFWIEGEETNGEMEVSGGQPGVFYFFRLEGEEGWDLGLPAYFHKAGKGLDQLAIEVDFVVTRSLPADADPAQVAPLTPLLQTGPLPLNRTLSVRARKAQTRVSIALNRRFEIPGRPAIEVEHPIVDYDGATHIRVIGSRATEYYQLLVDGQPHTEAVKGTGQNRLLRTDQLTEDTTFELEITQPDQPFGVDRVLAVTVLVRPDPERQLSAVETLVDYNRATAIQVENSQAHVGYRLLVDDEAVGDLVEGNGETITLPTGPLTQETTFKVRVTRIDNPELAVVLNQQVTVQLRPEPEE
jgi:hypothetical protein